MLSMCSFTLLRRIESTATERAISNTTIHAQAVASIPLHHQGTNASTTPGTKEGGDVCVKLHHHEQQKPWVWLRTAQA